MFQVPDPDQCFLCPSLFASLATPEQNAEFAFGVKALRIIAIVPEGFLSPENFQSD